MGEDKSLLPFGGYDTLVEYQYNKFSKLFKKIYLCAKANKFTFNPNIIYDSNKTVFSPMIALETIFDTLKDDKVFIITVDVPFINTSTIDMLIKSSQKYTVTIAKDKHKTHNLCGVFEKKILADIKKLLKNDIHKINYLIKNTTSYQELEFDNKNQFLNLNTTEDYNKALYISKDYR